MFLVVLLSIILALCLLYWLIMAAAAFKARAVPELRPARGRVDWPSLSVIVPARNEQEDLEQAASTLVAQDYPNLQLVFVDDRSTDATGAIVDRLAGDNRVAALHVHELPDRWLGKVHALHAGLRQASGELVLFTDADVHFEPGSLRAAVDFLLEHQLDHVAGFPALRPGGVIVGAMIAGFLRKFIAVTRPWKVSDPSSRAYIGIGAFNLVRRQRFLEAGGFEWLRMEVGDDIGVGLMMKRAGARSSAAGMADWLSLYWHRSVVQAARGAEKGWSSICQFSLARTVIMVTLLLVLELSPLWGPALLAWPAYRWLGFMALAILLAYLVAAAAMAAWMRQRVLAHLLSIVMTFVAAAVMLRAAILGRRRGGAAWRGTIYSTQDLRDGMRVKFL